MGVVRGLVLFGGLSVAYLVGIYLFVRLFSRFYDGDGTESSPSITPRRSPDSPPDDATAPQSAGVAAPTTVVCPTCGADNGREYTFCGNCVARLPTGRAGTPRDQSVE
ncbi:MAG: hypothetical protein ABEH78_11520 [Haloferacaceae archaeon]